ncbi:DUF4245 domain-containing protein [Microbacterium sp. HD4P20]|uniref:DUF4245 family protein n=1 Tax=Microbacterium sp. HD4P20 TaxID=2864874 RepID=UPI001C643AD9|nr:DUF4245 family protein [Microbacterium sp. HD4P20]MCP2637837.1 DUF4245 domain-containing protein [Microbacterium sp. HD4P20]
MARDPRVVAELGRPETPDETAARKAESSRVYRSSQNTRNLVAALLVTLAVVAVVVFAVPRGTPPAREPIDVAAVAERVGTAEGRSLIAPELSDDWIVNSAAVEDEGSSRAWTIVIAPANEDEPGFLRAAQGFDADEAWPARVLAGAAPVDTVTIGGVTWDRYELEPSRHGKLSVALAAPAGADTVLIYGTADDDALQDVAAAVADEVTALREESE